MWLPPTHWLGGVCCWVLLLLLWSPTDDHACGVLLAWGSARGYTGVSGTRGWRQLLVPRGVWVRSAAERRGTSGGAGAPKAFVGGRLSGLIRPHERLGWNPPSSLLTLTWSSKASSEAKCNFDPVGMGPLGSQGLCV